MQNDRSTIALALIGAMLAGLIAVAYPALIPAMTIVLAAFVVLVAFLQL